MYDQDLAIHIIGQIHDASQTTPNSSLKRRGVDRAKLRIFRQVCCLYEF